ARAVCRLWSPRHPVDGAARGPGGDRLPVAPPAPDRPGERRRRPAGMSGEGPPVARRLIVEGLVQGVGFRWFVVRRAQALGVGGWVRNLPDGRVEVVAIAGSDLVAQLEAAVREGPSGAHVTRVTSSDVPHEDVDAKSFTVRH